MIFMGVDPSLQHTGFTIWDSETMELLYQNACNNPSGSSQKGVAPYVKIKEATKALISQYQVKQVYIERMFQSKNPMVTTCLFNALFCVQLACHEMDVPYLTIAIMGRNNGWKHFIQGDDYTKFKGDASKKNTRRLLQSDLGVKFMSEHTADSAGIALTGWYLQTGTDYRAVLGKPIPAGIGITIDKPTKVGGEGTSGKRKPRKSAKPKPIKAPKPIKPIKPLKPKRVKRQPDDACA